MVWGRLQASSFPAKIIALFSLILAAALLSASSCGPLPPPTSNFKVPSKVITEAGVEFFVWRLKLPGTSQELKLKQALATTWVPLSAIGVITFTGPEMDRYRPAEIFLISGERLKGDLFVDLIIEGTTDLGYWNMPLVNVRQIGMGEE